MSQSFKADYTQNHPTSFDTNYHGQSASYSRDSQYAGQHTQHESESKYSSAATYVANDDGLMPSYSSKQNLLDDPQSRYISVDPESQNPKASNLQPLDYQNAPEPVTSQEPRKGWRAFMPEGGLYPLEQRIEAKRRGLGRQKYPFISWAFAVVMTGVLIYELVLNNHFQGTPLSFKPVVNPMLGPSQSALVTVGGRFPPCMKLVEGIPSDTKMACLNNTANPPDQLCSLEETCAFGGFHKEEPNQWFRFITPIFIHAGIIHLLLNMLAQSTSSAQIEREMGSGGFLLLYMAAGIFGNVLGGNFALVVAPSVGASGAIFGTIAATWVDLFAHWRLINRPGRRLAFQTLELVIGVIFGYIPYVDNFAHLGGFFMGLIFSMIFYPIISVSNRHKTIVWAMRIAAIPIAIVMFVVLIRNFYTSNPYASCDACRYLSCFPLKSNNYCRGNNGLTTVTVPSNPSSI